MILAENFVATIKANIDNKKLSDKKFRQFVRNTLPIVGNKPNNSRVEQIKQLKSNIKEIVDTELDKWFKLIMKENGVK